MSKDAQTGYRVIVKNEWSQGPNPLNDAFKAACKTVESSVDGLYKSTLERKVTFTTSLGATLIDNSNDQHECNQTDDVIVADFELGSKHKQAAYDQTPLELAEAFKAAFEAHLNDNGRFRDRDSGRCIIAPICEGADAETLLVNSEFEALNLDDLA